MENEIKTKVCNKCMKEKDINSFHKHGNSRSGTCNVCDYFKRHPEIIIKQGWTKEEYYIVLDNILNNKISCINELEYIIKNKTLDDIVYMIRDLKLKGVKLQIRLICDNCKKEYYERLYRYDSSINHLCNKDCNNKFFKNVISKSPEQRDKLRKNAINMLMCGKFNHTETDIQKSINEILEDMKIKYLNEYDCNIVSIDNAIFIGEKILFIECNGGFWHTDNRFYKTINYSIQKERIKKDKAKRTYIKKYFNIDILYLWEEDILNNIQLCKKLIYKYISNNGTLNNYHSFNYYIFNDKLSLKDNIIVPYMEYNVKELDEITNLSVKKRKEYHITFQCDCCGKETIQLISEYNKHKYHFCGYGCSSKFMGKLRKTQRKIG